MNFLLLFIIIVMACASVNGKSIQASSGSSSDLQSAINIASTGDTVKIPAGNFTYSGSVTCNAGITILGMGPSATILSKSGTSTNPFITVNGSNGNRCIIGGIALIGDQTSGSTLLEYGIRLINGCKNFRIFDCTFTLFGWAAVRVDGNARGVIDQCSIVNNYRPPVGNYGYGVVVFGDVDSSWNRPLNLGDSNAVFVEDCFFSGNRHAIASNNGSRYVFRHNRCDNSATPFQSIDAHGFEYGSPRGSRSYEIYYDTIDNATTCYEGVYIRGGDGVIFGNTIIRGTTIPIKLTNRCDGTGDTCTYPCKDQIRSLYVWNNTYQGSAIKAVVESGFENIIQENRDYFSHEKSGYTPYTYPHPLRNVIPVSIAGHFTYHNKVQPEKSTDDYKMNMYTISGKSMVSSKIRNSSGIIHQSLLIKQTYQGGLKVIQK